MPRTNNELTKIMLVACDMSYAADVPRVAFIGEPLRQYDDTPNYQIPGPFSIPSGYVVNQVFVDTINNTGFKAIALRGQSDVIIAFAGTDGGNLQDWKENLKFGWNQWSSNKASVFAYLDGLRAPNGVDPFTGKIHFTGQSLGGGLAEYAAYEFLARVGSQTAIDALKRRTTVTTFNGFGGAAILAQERGDFRAHMLADLSESAAYYIANDIISRLGVSHVGVQEYLLDYRSATPNPKTGLKYQLDPFDAHRIEPGFYRNYSVVLGFDESTNVRSSKIVIPAFQQGAALWANIFSEKTNAPGDAKWRLPAGIIGGALISPTEEMREFSREVIAAFDRSGAFNPFPHPNESLGEYATRKLLSFFGLSAANVLVNISRPSLYKPIAGLFAVAFGADANGRRAISDGFKKVLGADVVLSSVSDSELLLQSRLALAAIPGMVDEDVNVSKVFAGLNLDLATYADKVFADRADWLDDTLKYLLDTGFQFHSTAGARVNFEAALANLVQQEKNLLAVSGDAILQDRVAAALQDLQKHFAQALANTRSDFSSKYVLADASAFGATQFDFVAYNQYHDALEQTASNPEFSAIEPLFDEALEIVEAAGEIVDLEVERPAANPFDTPGFDPDTAPLPSEEVQEGGIERFTLSLPYGAGEGGQRVVIALDGTAAPYVKLLAGAEEVVAQDGVYTVVVEEGRRELELAVWGQIDVSEGGTLSLSATLVDEAGQATHQTHTEANVQFVVRNDRVFEGAPGLGSEGDDVLFIQMGGPIAELGLYVDYLGGNDVIWVDANEDRVLGGAGNDRLFGSWRAYFGANDRDWLSGGPGDDQLLGHEGDDTLEGDAGSDILLGDVGDDFLFGGSKADYATIFTLGGLDSSGDWVQGGAGKDLVVGSGGADALSGGNDADLIMGGAGNDEIRGDTEFVPTHTFQVFHTTFPPEQPLAGGADVLYGNAGSDTLYGEGANDLLYGGEGGDTLIGGEGQDELYGGAGDDFLAGDADSLDPLVHTDDFLHGGKGNDYLRGQGGSDMLIGDAGEDRLDGGGEADLYVFNRGDGVDTIFDEGSNTIRFGPGIDAEDLELGLGSLYIRIGDSGDAIRIENFNPDDVLGSYAVDSFEFFNGERLTYAQLIERGFDLAGTEEDDAISGTNVTDRISGGGGHDRLDGGAKADALNGGPGDDVYVVDEPGDVIHEAQDEGNDTVESSAESYVLGPNLENLVLTQKEHRPDDDEESPEGEESGQVVITGGIAGTGNELDNQIFGNALDNVLDGGAGNDFLAGDFGSDTYRFGRGSGADTIVEFDDSPGNLDSVQFAADVAPADIAISREADHLVLSIRNSADRVTLLDWFLGDAEKVEQASFADGTPWDAETLEAMADSGGNTEPTLAFLIPDQTANEDAAFSFVVPVDTFSDPGDALSFGAVPVGSARLPAWLSFDAVSRTFSGTPVNDDVGTFDVTVTATDTGGLSAAGTFRLEVPNVNDAPLLVNPLSDQFGNQNAAVSFQVPQGRFADVDAGDGLTMSAALADDGPLPEWLAFDPVIGSFSGTPSEFDVGAMDIRVTATDQAGAVASDTFTLSVSDASTVNETHLGTRRRDVIVTGFANDLIDVGRGDDIVHTGAGRDIVFGGRGEDRLYGEAGNDRLYGGRGGDTLDGGAGADLLLGGAGHDHLMGGAGENLLIGGAGRDTITGGPGGDVFLVNLGDGKDQLYLSGAAFEGNQDVLSLGGGIGADDISLKRDQGDLMVEARDADKHDECARVILQDWYRDAGDHQSVTTLQLFDGETAVTYDFKALVERFDAETLGPHHTRRWSAARALPAMQLTSGAEPLGGDIAREYAMGGTVLGDEPLADEDAEELVALPGGDWVPVAASNNGHSSGSSNKHDGNRGDNHSKGKRESFADLLEAYLEQKPHYDFEALAREMEGWDRHGEALNAHEIARRWRAVGQYASALANEHDEDARGGADFRFNDHGLLGGGAFGGGIGYSGSTGTLRRAANLQTLQGLEEGFQRLHS